MCRSRVVPALMAAFFGSGVAGSVASCRTATARIPAEGDDAGDPGDVAADRAPEPDEEPAVLPEGLPRGPREYPALAVRAGDRERILGRLEHDPWATWIALLRAVADRPYRERRDPAVYDAGAHGENGETARAAAFLAWLEGDPGRAEKARAFLDAFPTDFETHTQWDVNIRMPQVLMGHADAVDLLRGTPWLEAGEAAVHAAKIGEVAGELYDQYVEDEVVRYLVLGTTQNNHAIRTAAALGYTALAFPELPDAEAWASWAFSELDHLWGPDGAYVQPDGGVSEGPFYYGFAFAPTAALYLAWEGLSGGPRLFPRDCRNRSDLDPWAGHGCEEGKPFAFGSRMEDPLFRATADWAIALRLPDGLRPPVEDGTMRPQNGQVLLARGPGDGRFLWDSATCLERPWEARRGLDLLVQHLAFAPGDVAATPPDWTSRVMPEAGHAVLRSGWDPEARWLLLVAERGASRKTVHDHADGTSFSMAAYGEYLLVDPGYYKPDWTKNARTAGARSHNLVLIEGRTTPRKGYLTDFGDGDAFLGSASLGGDLQVVRARQEYRGTHVERTVVMVRGRFFVVGDRLSTEAGEPREHAWRLGGNAGHDLGGVFETGPGTMRWERAKAGVVVHLASTAPGLEVVAPPLVPFQSPHVHQMHLDDSVGHHGVADGVVTALEPDFLAVLAPYRTGAGGGDPDGPLAVEPVPAPDGVAAFTVASAEGTDLALLRTPGAATVLVLPGGTVVETDAELALVTLAGDPPIALVSRGSYVEVDAEPRLRVGAPAALAVIR